MRPFEGPTDRTSTTFSNELSLMRLKDRLAALEVVPSPAGEGWRVLIQWVSGRMQYVSGFASRQDAEIGLRTSLEGGYV
jgi:hypothetical protein